MSSSSSSLSESSNSDSLLSEGSYHLSSLSLSYYFLFLNHCAFDQGLIQLYMKPQCHSFSTSECSFHFVIVSFLRFSSCISNRCYCTGSSPLQHFQDHLYVPLHPPPVCPPPPPWSGSASTSAGWSEMLVGLL